MIGKTKTKDAGEAVGVEDVIAGLEAVSTTMGQIIAQDKARAEARGKSPIAVNSAGEPWISHKRMIDDFILNLRYDAQRGSLQ